ncbi:MAG: anthranilate synthase component I family protein [Phycisphaerales bacterium]
MAPHAPQLGLDPLDAIARWPRAAPLAALVSCDRRPVRSRWSILASPVACETIAPHDPDPIRWLRDTLGAPSRPSSAPDEPPFAGGWLLALAYHLGRQIEPEAARPGAVSAVAPPAALLRCPGAYIHDRSTGAWRTVGDCRALPSLDAPAEARPWHVGDFRADVGESAYRSLVERAKAYISAGDVYQVNVTRRLRASLEGDARAMFTHAARAMGAWYGAYMEIPGAGAAVSFSPELLVDHDARTRRLVTRPIKGTQVVEEAPDALLASEKDRAELAMIVDLMRNDLGRVCELGSVQVETARALERHGARGDIASSAVRHAVATVVGTRARERHLADIIGAVFPAGSVTGAPKVRAMQIIEELERSPREWYCGALGFASDTGDMALNVAIRSGWVRPGGDTLDYHIGAGIVADSDPALEWSETCAKAAGFLNAVGSAALAGEVTA